MSFSFTFSGAERISAHAQAETAPKAPPDPFADCGTTGNPKWLWRR
jgi:hypothetical protein